MTLSLSCKARLGRILALEARAKARDDEAHDSTRAAAAAVTRNTANRRIRALRYRTSLTHVLALHLD